LLATASAASAASRFASPSGSGTGKCVKPSATRRGHKCTRYQKVGRFKHADNAGLNRFRFTGRLHGKALRRGHYRLLSKPVNSAGESGRSHTNFFTIV
jgi:hypothetical protein